MAQSRGTLTQIDQIHALTNEQAAHSIPVELDSTVTFVEPQDTNLFLQTNGQGVFVSFDKEVGAKPGDLVHVSGVTAPSFRPQINATNVRVIGKSTLPKPLAADFKDLIQAKYDSLYVTVHGRVLSASLDNEVPKPGLRLEIQVPQGLVSARIAHPDGLKPAELMDAEIEITGVAGGDFDSRIQMAGVWMDVYSTSDLKVIKKPDWDAFAQPAVPMDQVIYQYRNNNESGRVKIMGTLTYFEPGALAVIERDGLGLLVETNSTLPLHAGQRVEATGFPEIVAANVQLHFGQLRELPQTGAVKPQAVSWEDATAGKYAYNLISMEGDVVAVVHDPRVDLFIIRAAGRLFSATLRHDSSESTNKREADLPIPEEGSKIRVSGVCFMDAGNHWRDRLWFDLRMRSMNDLVVLQPPSWWTTKRLTYMTTVLSAAILFAVIWVGFLDRRLRTQTAVLAKQSQEDAIRERRLARQEQERSHILELISSSVPLPKVLEVIQSTLSTRLFGAPCWFELSTMVGGDTDPQTPTDPAILSDELVSRDGNSLGFLLAKPLRFSKESVEVVTAIKAAGRLAELAIETRRLITDLRHRSEHDLLTDIPNRFSMEKHLEWLMHRAARNEGIFGLIYVDLDRFKQVNDQYGHRVGDLYLQEVTRRMKLQLRSEDVLARIGGDEFIALVPVLRSRADAEEIATRLERCFDEPFELNGYTLLGSASVGLAMYPENGKNQEELQQAADVAMYANKEIHKRQETLSTLMERMWTDEEEPSNPSQKATGT